MKMNKTGIQYSVVTVENLAANEAGKETRLTKTVIDAEGNKSRVPVNGIVTAKLQNTENDVLKIIKAYGLPFVITDESRYRIKSSYAATAYCHENDVFVEETGKQIAASKVLEIYNADKEAKLNLFLADVAEWTKRAETQLQIISERRAKNAQILSEARK